MNSKASLQALEYQIARFREKVEKSGQYYPLCIGFISHSTFTADGWDLFENVLEDYSPEVVQFFAGSVRCPTSDRNTDAVKVAQTFGCRVMMQVGTLEDAKQALEYGVDALIAQGTEAGGHGVRRELGCGTLSLTSKLVELLKEHTVGKSISLLAAGGIVDGRDLAAILTLGADGAVLGTRLWASNEAMGSPKFKNALVSARSPDDVVRTRAFDTIANSYRKIKWPVPFDSSGVLRNGITKQWDDDVKLERALGTPEGEKIVQKFDLACETTNDPANAPVYAGKGVGKIDSIDQAFDIVVRVEKEAIAAITAVSKLFSIDSDSV